MSPQHTIALEYRPSETDEPILRDAFADARSAEFRPMPEPMRNQLLEMQFTAQLQQYRAAYPHATDRIILSDGQPVGRVLVDTGPVETVLVDIAILAAHRGRGLGSAVLADLCHDADSQGMPIRLRAFAARPGLARWYERFGFSEVDASGAHLVFVRRHRTDGSTP